MRAGKPHFTVIEGEVLTITMKLSIGMRDNFGIVLSVKRCGTVSVVARCQGRPHASLLWSLGAKAVLNVVYDGFLALHRAKNLRIVQI